MFLAFLFKWAIALTLLYSLYGLLLRRETFYRVNRFVLLGMLPFSAWLATLKMETPHANIANRTVAEVTDWMEATPTTAAVDAQPEFSYTLIVVIIYYAGLIAVVLQYLFALIQVIRIIRKSRAVADADYCINDAVDSPFSWFRWIVISSKDVEENGRVFLAHERAHVRHGHSWDMLLCELCVRLQWFNPFAWQLREDLRAVHEFQADQSVIQAGCNVREYNMLLIDKALGSQLAPVANALTQGELKNRIRMMHRKPSPWMAVLKVLYVVPFALVTLAIFAKPIAVHNIVNARSASSIINNLKYVVSLSPEDALPEVYDDEVEAPKPAPAKPDEVIPTPVEAPETPEPAEAVPIENTPAAVAAKQQARIAEIKATNDYQRQRAEKAVADYLQMRVNTHTTETFIVVFINIILDREGNITDIELPGLSKEYTSWDPEEIKRHVRAIPHELIRDYVDNLPSPSNENVLRIELHQYLDI